MRSASLFLFAAFGFGCVATADRGTPTPLDVGKDAAAETFADATDVGDTGGFFPDVVPSETPTVVPGTTIYANTDTDLWRMDPETKKIDLIGEFDGNDIVAKESMTDVAVAADGKLWGISAPYDSGKKPGRLFELTLPSGKTGPIKATPRVTLPLAQRFYALGFAPVGILGTGEELVGGDNLGDLYLLPQDGSAPKKLGTFGNLKSGDPGGKPGDSWQVSGDVAFFENAGAPIGLVTLRACTTSCASDNDVVAEIDMTAIRKKDPSANLLKRLVGRSGTGFGRLFGVGAWSDQVFGFTRSSSKIPAQLVSISLSTGEGTLVQEFPDLASSGWSGAGVTTSAKVIIR